MKHSIPLYQRYRNIVHRFFQKEAALYLFVSIIYQAFLFGMIVAFFWTGNPAHSVELFQNLFSAWDGHHYLYLAQHGYQHTGDEANFIAFFPLYPLLIYILSFITRSVLISALLISNIGSIIGHTFFALYLRALGLSKERVSRILLLVFFSPVAVYFSIVYTEGLFLAEIAAFMYFLQKRKLWYAACAGLLAALTRQVGVLTIVPLLFTCFQLGKKYWMKGVVFSVVICLGYVEYVGINWITFNDPFYFQAVLKDNWHKQIANPVFLYYSYVQNVKSLFNIHFLTHALDVFSTLLTLPLLTLYTVLVFLKRKQQLRKDFSLGFIIWAFLQWIIVSSQTFWLSNARYIGLILPLYVMLEHMLRKASMLYWTFLLISFLWFFYGIQLFSKGAWLY